jgi:anti-sigma-K factor RskA
VCPHRDDAGPWVLGALDDDDARAFATHLEGCEACRAEVAVLRPVVDVLPMAAPQELPPPELKVRIMAVVESEAASAPRRARAARPWWRRPLPALAAACVVLVLGVAVGLLVDHGRDTTKTIPGFGPRGAQVALHVDDHHGRLDLRGMPEAPAGHVYQVWLVTGTDKPRATHALFSVPADGRARVEIPESLKGTDQVLITAEPPSGSVQPTSAPIAGAKLA